MSSSPQEEPTAAGESSSSQQPTDSPSAPEETTASSSSSRDPSPSQCSHCRKVETDPEKPFKPCSKCQSEKYCSRDCQKAGWKMHKKVCGEKAQKWAATANLKMDAPRVVKKEGHRGGLQKWQFDT
ncbi:hypothetical protein BJ878DRAFT_73794 [Calycina marina]|uniref:MYND-type domain-containing protein n=1 Tax=Calycina marina TaxID=1763456 RepID=A0A9P7Z3S8_9HELO|nr:hypothetical protein BJ878DRAFT_73794 [Calycina marina]